MSEAQRIDVMEARRRTQFGDALLVCAYDDEAKCRSMALAGSLTLGELQARQVGKDQEIVFYCT